MIEFTLLFAFGFLVAVLLVLMAAPVIHRRVVRFAEDRLKDTMPLSAQEVRAQKDAARAVYAAETARATLRLKAQSDKTVSLMVDNERLHQDHKRMAAENADLTAQMAEMNVEAGDLRSTCRQLESHVERLKSALSTVEHDNASKTNEIALLVRQLDTVSNEIDALREQINERDHNIEKFRERTSELRHERETLRNETRDTTTQAKELESRLSREESRIRQLEDRLEKQMAITADKETALERRNAEIERLKIRLKDESGDGIAAAPRGPGSDLRGRRSKKIITDAPISDAGASKDENSLDNTAPDLMQLAEMARSRAAALADPLNGPVSDSGDIRMRAEMADIAAAMVVMTAVQEGPASRIPDLLAKVKKAAPKQAGKSLADRVRDQLERRP